MRPIPVKMRKEIAADPFMKNCARTDDSENCDGCITWEHCWIYAGKQINEPWAIIGICEYHHFGEGMDKDRNQYISLQRATDEDLAKYPIKDWEQIKKYLASKFENEV